jgi:hypothetical protein
MVEYACHYCKASFQPKKKARKYCSTPCAQKARRRTWQNSFTDNFWLPEPNSGCWLWLGTVNRLGYGKTGKGMNAHRAAYLMAYGQIPEGLDVLHHCDVRCCVNPSHLFAGTHADNMHDMIQKGRHRVLLGEKHWAAKVTADDVKAIRTSSDPHKTLAARYGISIHTVHTIRDGRTWKHVAQTPPEDER